MRNEGPSDDDLNRFGNEGSQSGWCPDCDAEVYDEAEFCQECGNQISGRVLRRPRAATVFRKRMIILVTLVVIAVFFIVFGM
jgi:predicted amidophosphoribosyltransferase